MQKKEQHRTMNTTAVCPLFRYFSIIMWYLRCKFFLYSNIFVSSVICRVDIGITMLVQCGSSFGWNGYCL